MRLHFMILSLVAGLIFSAALSANAADCGRVVVDCKAHKITLNGRTTTIDCGRHTGEQDETINGRGTIGRFFYPPAPNDPVSEAVDIDDFSGMGMTNGNGKVFHAPVNGKNPPGRDNSHGCVHVSRAVLRELARCEGSALTIKGAYTP